MSRPSPAALALALAIPFVFLHATYQPSVTVAGATATLADFAILIVVVAALADGVRHGFEPLRGNRTIWVPLVAFCALVLLSLTWAKHLNGDYGLRSHFISASKFVEYAFLAAAAPLALRRESDRRAFLLVLLAWSAFLSLIAVLQFLGLVHEFRGRRPEQREPSYIGVHDLGAFSGAALSVGFAALLLGLRRREGRAGMVSGAFGVAIAAALDSVGGMLLTAAAAFALVRRRGPASWRRVLAMALVCAIVTVAAVSLRGAAIRSFLQFLGITPAAQKEKNIETYAQRTLLVYIGVEIFVHHPLLGVGWQASELPHAFEPYLAQAHRRFPRAAPQSFPSRAHLWGVQNGIVQTLADLGVVGGVVLASLLLATLRLLVRVAARGPPDLLWWSVVGTGLLFFAFAVFTGSGLLPGLPVDALLWLSVGLAVSLHNSLTTEG